MLAAIGASSVFSCRTEISKAATFALSVTSAAFVTLSASTTSGCGGAGVALAKWFHNHKCPTLTRWVRAAVK